MVIRYPLVRIPLTETLLRDALQHFPFKIQNKMTQSLSGVPALEYLNMWYIIVFFLTSNTWYSIFCHFHHQALFNFYKCHHLSCKGWSARDGWIIKWKNKTNWWNFLKLFIFYSHVSYGILDLCIWFWTGTWPQSLWIHWSSLFLSFRELFRNSCGILAMLALPW